MPKSIRDPKDKYILFAFLAFFGTIFLLDGIFAYTAISTQTGLVTDQAYEKGLHYNDMLQEAKNQPKWHENALYEAPTLRWTIADEDGKPITEATVTARLIRPVQEGADFDITLVHKGNGIYETVLELPFNGLWEAKLESQWDNKTYKTTYQFIQR